MIIKESKKANAPKDLLKLIEKQNKAKIDYEISLNKLDDYSKKLKTEKLIYNEVRPTISNLRREKWKKKVIYDGCKIAITYFPIIPLIIPTPIDIN